MDPWTSPAFSVERGLSQVKGFGPCIPFFVFCSTTCFCDWHEPYEAQGPLPPRVRGGSHQTLRLLAFSNVGEAVKDSLQVIGQNSLGLFFSVISPVFCLSLLKHALIYAGDLWHHPLSWVQFPNHLQKASNPHLKRAWWEFLSRYFFVVISKN